MDDESVVNPEAVEFFVTHAGWAEPPGRRACAVTLAYAEGIARLAEWDVEWSDDWDVDHVKEFDCYEDGPPTSCEAAVLRDVSGRVRASLGCVDDATPEYRRVVEAELALEAIG